MFTKEWILKTAQEHDSFYLYDEDCILDRIQTLKEFFPRVSFLYSVKCNPNPEIIQTMADQGLGADAASAEEVFASLRAGMKREDIYYSAPGKSERDIEKTLDQCTLIADSPGEVERITAAAKKAGKKIRIGIRIHPDFPFEGERSAASKFGIEEEQFFSRLPRWKQEEAIQNLRNPCSSEKSGFGYGSDCQIPSKCAEIIGESSKRTWTRTGFYQSGSGDWDPLWSFRP